MPFVGGEVLEDGDPASSYPGGYEGAWYDAVGGVVDQGVEPFSKFEADAVVVGHAGPDL